MSISVGWSIQLLRVPLLPRASLASGLPAIIDRVKIRGLVGADNEPQIGIDFNGNSGLSFAGRGAGKSSLNGLALFNSDGDSLALDSKGIRVSNVDVGRRFDGATDLGDLNGGISYGRDISDGQGDSLDPLTGQALAEQESSPIGCTRILWNDNPTAILVGRNGDWFGAKDPKGSSGPRLLAMPRGLRKSGAMYGDQVVVTENPAKWKSRYGSLLVSNLNTVVFEGVNEKGLAAHNLSLSVSDYGPRDVSRQGLQMGLWIPYILDQAATVEEAISLLPRIQPIAVEVDNFALKVSLVIEDRSGDSAVIEYLDGVPVVHRGPEVRVVTNTKLAEAKALLPLDKFEGATNQAPIPGNNNTKDRFVRASFYSSILSGFQPRTTREARAALLSVMRKLSNPIGSPYTSVGVIDETDWRSLSDLTNLGHIFDNPRVPSTLYTDLKRLDFSRGTGVRAVNPQKPDLQGNITGLYRPVRVPVPGLINRSSAKAMQ